MIPLIIEGANMGWGILLAIFMAFGVPVLLLIIGLAIRPKKRKASKIILIIAAVYSLIGLGICGSMFI